LALFIDADFDSLDTETVVDVQIAMVKQDSKGNVYGHLSAPDEKITAKTMHKVVMISME
jgi:hypothetical protein